MKNKIEKIIAEIDSRFKHNDKYIVNIYKAEWEKIKEVLLFSDFGDNLEKLAELISKDIQKDLEHPDCLDCDEGLLFPTTFSTWIKVEGKPDVFVDDLECMSCDKCGADPVFPDQIVRNREKCEAAKKWLIVKVAETV